MRPLRLIAVAASFVLASAAHGQAPASDPSDMARGNPKAPVTIIEYASVGCSHCGHLHNTIFPAFKKKYIDTGKVRWISREMITGDPRIATAGFLLARCAPKGRYFDVTDAVYRDQEKLFADPKPGMIAIAKAAGMTEADFDKCLGDDKNYDALDARTALAEKDGVHSTPTLMINGKDVAGGDATLADLDKVVANAMPKPKAKTATKPAAKPATKPTPKAAQQTPARK